eukprot:3130091-Prymnesium_polylepis.1
MTPLGRTPKRCRQRVRDRSEVVLDDWFSHVLRAANDEAHMAEWGGGGAGRCVVATSSQWAHTLAEAEREIRVRALELAERAKVEPFESQLFSRPE